MSASARTPRLRSLLLLALGIVAAGLLVWVGYRVVDTFTWRTSPDPAAADLSAFNTPVAGGDHLAIQPDVRVFALFAYLNSIGGYDEEWGDAMAAERLQLRRDVAARLAQVDPQKVAAWKRWAGQHRAHPWAYLQYTLTLGRPPAFAPVVPRAQIDRPEDLYRIKGFERVLADFYSAAGLEQLWRDTYRDVMARAAQQYDPARVARDLDTVYGYLRWPQEQRTLQVIIVPLPFDSHASAWSIGLGDTIYILDGPGSNGTQGMGLNVHELLHKLVNPLVIQALRGHDAAVKAAYQANRDKPYVKGNYGSPQSFSYECLVRAIDYRLAPQTRADLPDIADRVQKTIARESENGLALVPQYYDALAAYEANPATSMEAFVRGLVQGEP